MEYRDSWWEPLNSNFTKLDVWAQRTDQELVDARFQAATLGGFLSVGHNPDGTLIATAEMIAAENSPVYGFQDTTVSPAVRHQLSQRLAKVDWEMWKAREAQTDLRALHAFRQNPKSMILRGLGFSEDNTGVPSWMGSTGANVQVDGSSTPLWLSIDGKLGRVRTLKQVTLTGAAGTKYIYANLLSDGDALKIIVDGDATVAPPSSPVGATSLDENSDAVYFNDAGGNFTSAVQVGDLLNVIDNNDAGQYIVSQVVSNSQLKIVGTFPVGGIASTNYTISDPMAVNLGFDTAETPTAGRIYIGEAYFNGTSVADFPGETGIKIKPRHFLDTYVSAWVAVDTVTGVPNLGTALLGYFQNRFRHNIGSDKLDITIQASQANDGSRPVEELTLGSLVSTLDVDVVSTLEASKLTDPVWTAPSHGGDSFNAGTSDATYSQGSFDPGSFAGSATYELTGDVTASLTGGVSLLSGVRCKWDKNSLWVKNSTKDKFYTDYDDNDNTAGFIRVIVRKRG